MHFGLVLCRLLLADRHLYGWQSDEHRRAISEARWDRVADKTSLRTQAVQALLQNPTYDEQRPAAQLIASMARIDFSRKEWSELIPGLLGVMRSPAAPPTAKRAVLTCIAYVANAVDESPDALPPALINDMLAVCLTYARDASNMEIQAAAMSAVSELLPYCEEIFTSPHTEPQRAFLVETTCEACAARSDRVRAYAAECLANIGSMYYDSLRPFIPQLFKVTSETIAKAVDEDSTDGMMAIEFWTQLAEIESGKSSTESHAFVNRALPHLAPLLWDVLTTKRLDDEPVQEEDDGVVNLFMCASALLRQLAIVDFQRLREALAPKIDAGFGSADWRQRDAAVMALGFIAEASDGAREDAVPKDLIQRYFPSIMSRLLEGSGGAPETDERVANSLTWCASIILRNHFAIATVINGADLVEPCISVFEALLTKKPHIARYAAMVRSSSPG